MSMNCVWMAYQAHTATMWKSQTFHAFKYNLINENISSEMYTLNTQSGAIIHCAMLSIQEMSSKKNKIYGINPWHISQ